MASGTPLTAVPPPQRPWSETLPDGYPKFAQMMGLNPELAMLRRFAALNTQILLHKQCELITLENRYRQCELQNSQSALRPHNRLCRNAALLNHSKVANDEQVKVLKELEPKLKEYGEALQLQHALANMPEPSKLDVDYLQHSMIAVDGDEVLLPLSGDDRHVWGAVWGDDDRKREAPDLVVLHGRRDIDPFSRWVTGSGLQHWFACGFDRGRKPSAKYGIVGYSEKSLLRITFWITTVIASALPVLSIIILNEVHAMQTRLALIAVFNVLCSVCLLLFSDAKRSEIFAVAAGFAAVQVVWVGTASVGNKSN